MSLPLAVETSNLTKELESQFLRKRFRVLDSINISVPKGETYGLLGLNGAGKTTTLKLLLGLMRPTSGSVNVLGAPAGTKAVLAKVGFLPENPYFYSHLTGRECLDFIGSLFAIESSVRKKRTAELLMLVEMTEAADVPMRKYSKGMLQRIGIAQCLVNEPEIVFLDEPMSGLDILGRKDMRNILSKLKSEGRTIFFNSHLLPDVNEVCDRIGILHKGRLISQSPLREIAPSGAYTELEDYFLEALKSVGATRTT
ncbi:MAG TPA: ABC transporter ATP-binding protein [Oculatellaceae cyanobacterium]